MLVYFSINNRLLRYVNITHPKIVPMLFFLFVFGVQHANNKEKKYTKPAHGKTNTERGDRDGELITTKICLARDFM